MYVLLHSFNCFTLAEDILAPLATVGHVPILGMSIHGGMIIDFELVFLIFAGLAHVPTVQKETEWAGVGGHVVDLGPVPIPGRPLVHTHGPTLGPGLALSLLIVLDHLDLLLLPDEHFWVAIYNSCVLLSDNNNATTLLLLLRIQYW